MRDYGKVAPGFWTGSTGRAIRGNTTTQLVALYLLTNPHANMLGLYYLPLTFLAHEVGIPSEGASKALESLSEAGFCAYDNEAEHVWVFAMAKYQVAEFLKEADNRVAGVRREYAALPDNAFLAPFFDRYGAAFHLIDQRGSEGASEGLRSQEQEQEQEQEKEQEQEQGPSEGPSPPPSGGPLPARAGEDGYPKEGTAIPIKGGCGYHVLTQAAVKALTARFPMVDVPRQLVRIAEWNENNAKRRKKAAGIDKHIETWLAEEQAEAEGHTRPRRRLPGDTHTGLTAGVRDYGKTGGGF